MASYGVVTYQSAKGDPFELPAHCNWYWSELEYVHIQGVRKHYNQAKVDKIPLIAMT